jgi:hypothetical protein
MPKQYGIVKVDYITYTTGASGVEADHTIDVSGLAGIADSGVTVTGTISGISGIFASGITVDGSGVFESLYVSGTTILSGNVTASGDLGVSGQLTASSITVTDDATIEGNLTISGDINASGVTISGITGLFASGTEAAPSISFVDDTDTGIYSPNANQVALATSGTGRLFVDSSGRVGIGNASPSSNGLVTITETTNARLYLTDSTLGNAYGAQLRGYGTSSLGAFAELGVVDNNDYKKAITITQQAQSVIFNTGTDERMRIDRSGRLLVGTSSSRSQQGIQSLAQVEHTDYTGLSLVVNNTDDNTCPIILIGKSKGSTNGSSTVVSTNSRLGVISFQGADGTDIESAAATIECRVDGNPGANDMPGRLEFRTTADGATSATERMRIDSSGRVGIGTSSPEGAGLDLSSSRTTNYNSSTDQRSLAHIIARNESDGANRFSSISLVNGGSTQTEASINLIQAGNYIGNLAFKMRTGSSSWAERMRIDSSGRLLVGKTSGLGESKFQIQGTTSSVNEWGGLFLSRGLSNTAINTNFYLGELLFGGSEGSVGAIIRATADDSWAASDYPGRLIFFTTPDSASDPVERMRIDSSGNVGIGTTSPTQPLDVVGWVKTSTGLLGTTGRVTTGSGGITISTGATDNPIIFQGGPGGANVERMRIDTSGRLLVGTSSAVAIGGESNPKLQLVDASATSASWFNLARFANSPGAAAIQFGKSRGATVGDYTVVQSGDTLGSISFAGADGTDLGSYAAQIKAEVDGTPGSNDMPGRLVFSTTADGASSPTERMRIESNGRIKLATTTIYNSSNGGIYLGIAGVYPTNSAGTLSDNVYDLGNPSYRWDTVYAGTGTIDTSDANLKQDIENLDAAELTVATAIKGLIKKYRFTDAVSAKGDDARIHVGVIAQEVEQAFLDAGLDASRYALFCRDTWYEVDGSAVDSDGNEFTAETPGAVEKTRLGIRYSELLAFVIAAL